MLISQEIWLSQLLWSSLILYRYFKKKCLFQDDLLIKIIIFKCIICLMHYYIEPEINDVFFIKNWKAG